MKTMPCAAWAEFITTDPENCLRVEPTDEEVVIRAKTDNFTETRKSNFVRYLAAEGFIPAHYRWLNDSGPYARKIVHWVVDASWLEEPQRVRRATEQVFKRIALPLGAGALIAACGWGLSLLL